MCLDTTTAAASPTENVADHMKSESASNATNKKGREKNVFCQTPKFLNLTSRQLDSFCLIWFFFVPFVEFRFTRMPNYSSVSFRCSLLIVPRMLGLQKNGRGKHNSEIFTRAMVPVIFVMHRRFCALCIDPIGRIISTYCSTFKRRTNLTKIAPLHRLTLFLRLECWHRRIRFEQRNPTIKRSKSIFVYVSDFFQEKDWRQKCALATFEIWMGFTISPSSFRLVFRPIIILYIRICLACWKSMSRFLSVILSSTISSMSCTNPVQMCWEHGVRAPFFGKTAIPESEIWASLFLPVQLKNEANKWSNERTYIMQVLHISLWMLCCVIFSSLSAWNLHYQCTRLYLERQTNTYAWPIYS